MSSSNDFCKDYIDASTPRIPNQCPDNKSILMGPQGGDPLYNETSELMKSFLGDFVGLVKPKRGESKALPTMKEVVGQLLRWYPMPFCCKY